MNGESVAIIEYWHDIIVFKIYTHNWFKLIISVKLTRLNVDIFLRVSIVLHLTVMILGNNVM